jgi:flagellar hook-associated protein 3 FlgL
MTGISNLGQALDQISRLKSQQIQLDSFSTQIATGKKTQQFSGLNGDVIRSQRARADLNAIDQYDTNINNGHRRIELMVQSIQQIAAQANTLTGPMTSVQGGDLPDFETVQQLATDVHDFIIDLINSKDGERYLFAGSDSSVKPINEQGQFDSYLGNFVPNEDDIANPPLEQSGFFGEWGAGLITTEEFIDAYSNVNENVLGYSESLVSGSTGDVRIRVDENSDFDYTMLGNADGLKDLVISLGVLKNLPPPAYAPGALNDPTAINAGEDIPPFPSSEKQEAFFAVVNDIGTKIVQAVDKLEKEEYRLELVHAQTSVIQEQYLYERNSLQSVIADVEDIDLTETIAKLQQTQLGLEASFSVTALISDLTLVNFLN